MTPELDEPEVLQAMRGWTDSQRLLAGVPDPVAPSFVVDAGWHDTSLDDHEGAFCLVASDGLLEDLVGDVVRVESGDRSCMLYCIGGAALPTELSLSRPAFLRLAALAEDAVQVTVRRAIQGAVAA